MVQVPAYFSFLKSGSETSDLIASVNWADTSLGSADQWPQSLRTALGIMLHSKFPMFIFWGRELICFYNDAYRPSLGNNGKHPAAMGKPGKEVWPEIWHIIKPLIDQVLSGGEATWNEDSLIPIYRNGKIEDVYWTFSYSAIKDESGSHAGVFVTCTETTQKVQLLKKAVYSEQQFRNMISQAPVGIAILKGEKLVVETANEPYLQIVARKKEHFVGRPLLESLPEVKERVEMLLLNVLKTGEPYYGTEFPVDIIKNGSRKQSYFNFVYQPLRENGEDITGIIVIATDVTYMVNAREATLGNEKKFRDYVNASPIPIGIYTGREMRIQAVNEAILRTWDKDASVIGKTFREALPELEGQPFYQLLDDVYTTGLPYHTDNDRVDLLINGEMKTFYFNFTYTPLKDEKGKVYGILNTAVDVTALVTAQQRLEESEKKFRNLIYEASVPTALLSGPEYVIEIANRAALQFWGKEDDIIGKRLIEAIPELEGQPYLDILDTVYNTSVTYKGHEDVVYLKTGGILRPVYVNFNYKKLDMGSKSFPRILLMGYDVTEQVLARRKAEEGEQRLNMALEYTNTGSWDLNLQSMEIIYTPQLGEIFGYSADEKLTHKMMREHLHEEDREALVLQAFDKAMKTGLYYYEARVLRRDRTTRWIRTKGKVIYGANNTPLRMLGTMVDITDIKNEQNRKDEFIGIISHELRTPLTSLKGFAQFLHQRSVTAADSMSSSFLSKMERQVDKLNNLVQDLLDVTRIEGGKLKFTITEIEFNRFVAETTELVQVTTLKKIEIEREPGEVYIDADRERLGQVLINLLTNAIKYSPGADRIIVTVTCNENNILCEVTDFGIGIAKENQRHVFERFYRETEDKSNTYPGMGLGLYISAEFINRLNGKIWVKSEKGIGSTFGFSLPINRKKNG